MRIESQAALAVAALLLGSSMLSDRRHRAVVALTGLTALLVLMLRLSLHLSVPMGDYGTFTEDKHHFENYFGDKIAFQYHLSAAVVHFLNALFGDTSHSPVQAFDALARIAAVLFVLALGLFVLRERWSAQALRYTGLAVAVPTTLLFFGYHEFGHLPAALNAAAIPLALVGLEQRRRNLVIAAGALAGLGCALHGFGLVALGFVVVLVGGYLWRDAPARTVLGRNLPLGVAAAGLLGWLIWLPVYLIGLNWRVVPGHADEGPLRPLLHARYVRDYDLLDKPILSTSVIAEIGWELAVTGAALVLLAAWFVRGPGQQALLIATVPVLIFVVWFWPTQGIGNDTDFLGSAFPATYAGAWLIARNVKASAIGFLVLVAGNAAIAHILTEGFVHHPLDRASHGRFQSPDAAERYIEVRRIHRPPAVRLSSKSWLLHWPTSAPRRRSDSTMSARAFEPSPESRECTVPEERRREARGQNSIRDPRLSSDGLLPAHPDLVEQTVSASIPVSDPTIVSRTGRQVRRRSLRAPSSGARV